MKNPINDDETLIVKSKPVAINSWRHGARSLAEELRDAGFSPSSDDATTIQQQERDNK